MKLDKEKKNEIQQNYREKVMQKKNGYLEAWIIVIIIVTFFVLNSFIKSF